MFLKKLLGAAFITAICMSGCTFLPQPKHYVETASPTYDPAIAARIRILAANGQQQATFTPGKDCYTPFPGKDSEKIIVNDGYFSAIKYSSTSLTIGMPLSPRPWMRTDGLIFKDFIKEYVVAADKPLTVLISSVGSAGNTYIYCTPPRMTFTPKPGRNYDIFMEHGNKQCWISVRDIDEKGADMPVAMKKAGKCSPSEMTN